MQNPTTLTLPPVVTHADPNYPEKKYQQLKSLLDKGQREQVITELKILYPKDPYLANSLANRLGIDIQKELGIYHYRDSNYSTTAQITNENSFEITTQYDNFHDTLETIRNYSQYKGNVTDTLMAGISGIFGAVEKGAEKITELAGGKYQIAKYLFKAEGISVSATYGYGSNNRDMVKTAVSVGLEVAGSSFIGLVLEGVLAALGMTSIPAFVIVGAISALTAGILMNTQAGKDFVNFLTDKLRDFFSLFDSNPSAYELVPNPTLQSQNYKSLIELLLHKDSNALDIDTLLHTFPNYLAYPTHATTNSTNSSLALSTPKEALPIHIKAQCFNHKNEPLANKEIYVYSPNFYSFVDRARSDENGFIEFNNACVSSNMTNSDLYFVLNRCGLDEEQKDFHTKISPSKTIQPKDKKARKLTNQTLVFNKHIPKTIKANDSIKPNIKVISIECKDIKYAHNNTNTQVKAKSNTPHNITMNNTSIKSHHTNNTIESITLKAHYVLRDSQRQYIQGDETTYTQDSIQRHKHKTKWGYIVFDKEEDIEQTLKQVNKTQPLIYSKRFKELEHIKGERVTIPFKEEWQDKQIRFFAYLWRANRDVGIDVHYQATIPDNVIRIETLDESDEFIEIVLPPTLQIDDPPLEDMSAMFIPALRGIGSAIKGVKGVTELSRSLTREEVLEVVGRLPKGLKSNGEINERIYLVKSKKELDELWEKLTKNAKELEAQIDKRHGKPIYRRQLDDGTNINYRVDSKTGGETIDINSRNPKVNVKIHIDKGM